MATSGFTTFWIKMSTKQKLDQVKKPDESMNQLIERLVDFYLQHNQPTQQQSQQPHLVANANANVGGLNVENSPEQ